jgi:site-specific DNA recombinase
MTTAAIYVRVSSRKQALEEKTSLADQEKECRAYAEREGWPVAAAFTDTMTGYETMYERPALQEVRDLIQSSGADVLLVWRFDRAARDQVDLLVLNREVNNAGARLVSATEGPVDNSATGRGMLGMRGMIAEGEREALIARTQGAIRTKAKSGKLLVGANPKYGYVYAGDRKEHYAINPETAPVVQRIFDLADAGTSIRKIAAILNEDRIPPPSRYLAERGHVNGRAVGAEWRRQNLYKLLKDPSYCGRHIAYRRKRIKGGTSYAMRDEHDPQLIEQTIPAIVTVEQWERVQAAIAGNELARYNDADKDNMPLLNRGIAYCGHCGARSIVAKHATGYRGYACPNRSGKRQGQPACSGGAWFMKSDPVDAGVWAQVSEMRSDTERFRQMMLAPLQETQAKLEQANRQEANLAAELEQARKERETISRRMTSEEDDDIAAMYRTRYKETLALISQLEARQGSQDRKADRLRAYLDTLFSAATGWQDAEGNDVAPDAILSAIAPTPGRDQKRNLLRAIGARVLLYSSKSDYAKANAGKRWDLQIIPDVDLLNTTS